MSNEKIIELFKAMKDDYWKLFQVAKEGYLPEDMIATLRSSWAVMYTVVGVMTDPGYADRIAAIYLEQKEDN